MSGAEYLAVVFVMVIARVTAFLSTFPLFRSGMIPQLIKVAFALSLSVMWLSSFVLDGSCPLPESLPSHWLGYGMAIIREAVIGALLGYLLGLLFIPAQIAGSYLGQEIGFNMAGMTDPTTDASSNVYGDLMAALGTLVFLAVDAHQLAIGAIFSSFRSLPLGQALPSLPIATVSESLSTSHHWGLELAAPLGTGLFLATVINAMLMKISPQLNLFSVGIPVRLLLGLVAAMIVFPETAEIMRRICLQQAVLIRHLGI